MRRRTRGEPTRRKGLITATHDGRTSLLGHLVLALTSATDVPAAMDAAIEAAAESIGAEAAACWIRDDAVTLRCAAARAWSADADPFVAWCREASPPSATGAVVEVMEAGRSRWVRGPRIDGDPVRSTLFERCGVRAVLTVPLRTDGQAVGALELLVLRNHRGQPRLDVVEVAAAMLALRIAKEHADRACADAERLRDALFAAAPDAFVAIDRDGRVTVFSPSAERLFGYRRDEAVGHDLAELIIPPSFRPFHDEGVGRYRLTGEGRLLGRRTRLAAMRSDGSQFPVDLSVVPVEGPGGSAFAAFVHDATNDADIERALVESGQRFAEQGRALHRSLLPQSIPSIEGLDLAVRYAAAGEDAEVGGDFYDVFPVSNGDWVITIGDVQGKGLETAGVMALARFTLRTAASHAPQFSAVVSTLNDVLASAGPGRLCTLAYGRLSASPGGFRLDLGLAGHPPPLRVRAGYVEQVGRLGLVLGVAPGEPPTEQSIDLEPGDVIVFYTDGLTEARSSTGEFLGEERVMESLGDLGHEDATTIALALERLALGFQHDNARDDIALVVLKVPTSQAR